MIPLRVVAIVSNVLFISYGIVGGHGPRFVLQVTLLPLDIHRLLAMRRLIRRAEEAVRTQSFNANWLQPYMKPELFRAGDIIFCTGDIADGGCCSAKSRCSPRADHARSVASAKAMRKRSSSPTTSCASSISRTRSSASSLSG